MCGPHSVDLLGLITQPELLFLWLQLLSLPHSTPQALRDRSLCAILSPEPIIRGLTVTVICVHTHVPSQLQSVHQLLTLPLSKLDLYSSLSSVLFIQINRSLKVHTTPPHHPPHHHHHQPRHACTCMHAHMHTCTHNA